MSCTRTDLVKQMQSWVGLKESNGSFKVIVDTYNSIRPLPVGYKLKYTDAWCAGTVSAAAQKCGATDIIPTECSCPRMITKAQNMGIWVENDAHVPQPGDIIMYDWHDNDIGDNKNGPDHVGVVEKISGNIITVIEGNYHEAVGRRSLEVNGRYIRGYIVPKYDAESAAPVVKKVYVNPGHSDTDPGAVGYETERKLAVKVSEYQRDHLLANYNVDIRMNPGTLSNLAAIAEDANNWGADFFCSNHFNAGGGDGYEALIYSAKNEAMGRIFEKYVVAAGQNSRGVKYRPNLVVLKMTDMPAILNEGAFVDNKTDIQDWNEDAELKKLGVAYAEAAAEYLQLTKKVVEPTPEPEEVKPEASSDSVKLPVLSKGSEGDTVKALQTLLIGYGYSCGVYGADGDFGNGTEMALKDFQREHNLDDDGVCGVGTWTKLLGL